MEAARQRQVNRLMAQAEELRSERKYDDAISTLKQVQVIDPSNDRAAWMTLAIDDFRSPHSERANPNTTPYYDRNLNNM